MRSCGIAVVGGGVIGLSLALELRLAGADVCVLADDAPGTSTLAAAGMLAAEDPHNPRELLGFARESVALYPAFLDRVNSLARSFEVSFETHETLQEFGPGSFERIAEWSLDPRRLHAALREACAASDVRTVSAQVSEVHEHSAGVRLLSSGGEITVSRWVNCAGAWASRIPGCQLPEAAVIPRKGQMVRLANTAALDRVMRGVDIYAVPRRDDTVLVGATVENSGMDARVRPEVSAELSRGITRLVPALSGALLLDAWIGFRPGTVDGLPLLGQVSERGYVATGHFRNGILLAPATAAVMTRLLSGLPPDDQIAAFSPERCGVQRCDNHAIAAL